MTFLIYCIAYHAQCTEGVEYMEDVCIAWQQRQCSRDGAIQTVQYITLTTTKKIIYGRYQIFYAFVLLPLILTP